MGLEKSLDFFNKWEKAYLKSDETEAPVRRAYSNRRNGRLYIIGQNSSLKYTKLIILSLDISSIITFLENLFFTPWLCQLTLLDSFQHLSELIPHLFERSFVNVYLTENKLRERRKYGLLFFVFINVSCRPRQYWVYTIRVKYHI